MYFSTIIIFISFLCWGVVKHSFIHSFICISAIGRRCRNCWWTSTTSWCSPSQRLWPGLALRNPASACLLSTSLPSAVRSVTVFCPRLHLHPTNLMSCCHLSRREISGTVLYSLDNSRSNVQVRVSTVLYSLGNSQSNGQVRVSTVLYSLDNSRSNVQVRVSAVLYSCNSQSNVQVRVSTVLYSLVNSVKCAGQS